MKANPWFPSGRASASTPIPATSGSPVLPPPLPPDPPDPLSPLASSNFPPLSSSSPPTVPSTSLIASDLKPDVVVLTSLNMTASVPLQTTTVSNLPREVEASSTIPNSGSAVTVSPNLAPLPLNPPSPMATNKAPSSLSSKPITHLSQNPTKFQNFVAPNSKTFPLNTVPKPYPQPSLASSTTSFTTPPQVSPPPPPSSNPSMPSQPSNVESKGPQSTTHQTENLAEKIRRRVNKTLTKQPATVVMDASTPQILIPDDVFERGAEYHKDFII